jgi:hypothetical protein
LWGLFGCGESGEGEGGRGGGGELQHLASGVSGFDHRGNLRTMVWISNYGEGEKEIKAAKDDN